MKKSHNIVSQFDKLAPFYNLPPLQIYHFFTHKFCLKFIKSLITKESNILDLACGTGKFLGCIKKVTNNLNLFGIDSSPKMIEIAKKNSQDVNFIISDAKKIPTEDNFFDLITIIDAFYYFEDKEKVLEECNKKLKPKKYLFICHMAIDLFPEFFLKILKLTSKIFFLNLEENSTFPKKTDFKEWGEKYGFKIIYNKPRLFNRYILLQKIN